MSLSLERKTAVIGDARRHDTDTGSPEVQISILTTRIKDMTEHMKENKHDYHSRRGLVQMVAKRNKLLKYIARKDRDAYLALIKRLGLRR
ncbi:MAG: 30S ribosomal protein S15 [Planctomycetota bacterium]|jgi:small subunit ribosomal protein S15